MTIKEVLKGCSHSKQYETRYQGGSPHIVMNYNALSLFSSAGVAETYFEEV